MTHDAPVTPQNCAMFSSICLSVDDLDLLDLDCSDIDKESDLAIRDRSGFT